MPTRTILEVLSDANVTLDATWVHGDTNTEVDTSIEPTTWVQWKEFNYKTLTAIYGHVLDTKWKNPPDTPWASFFDTFIMNEYTLDVALHRYIVPMVNEAVYLAAKATKQAPPISVTGLAPRNTIFALSRRDEQEAFVNVLPGDTKLDRKWHPLMIRDNHFEWQKPVAQVMTYMAVHRCRYGFIITDVNLVVLRISRKPIPDGASAERPRRGPHMRYTSNSSDISMITASMSGMSWNDDNPLNWDYYPPEFAVVPWSRHGSGKLTVKLALFCLCMMASGPDTDIDSDYKPLHSWTQVGDGYVHNTSGHTVKSKPKDGEIYKGQAQGQSSAQGAGGASSSRQHHATEQYQQQYAQGQYPKQQHYDEYEEGDYEEQLQRFDSPPNDDEGYDTPRAGPSTRPKMYEVEVTKKRGSYYYTSRRGVQTETKKSLWNRVEGGWVYSSAKSTYFTREWP